MKRRLILLATLLGVGSLVAVGIGARKADCGTCPACDKSLQACMKVVEPKCQVGCKKQCESGSLPDCYKCTNHCRALEEAKCNTAYKTCLSQPCP